MKKLAYFFIIATGSILALIYGKTMMIQFVVAFLLWFATFQINKSFCKIKWFKRFIPGIFQYIIVAALLILVLYLVMNMVMNNLMYLSSSFSNYENNINTVTSKIDDLFQIDIKKEVNTFIRSLNIKYIISGLTESLSNIFSNFTMILIYLLFFFLETKSVKLKLKALFPDPDKRKKFDMTLAKIEKSLAQYFHVKTLISILTGMLSFAVLKFIGVDAALFWAFLIFALNYIPTIGSLIATIFPAVFSLLQFGSFMIFILILLLIGSIQMIAGNVVEPKLMGKTLNVSPMVTILALAFWGKLWGVTGTLFSVPITVIIIIILSQFKSTEKIAVILSEKGDL
ncbi:MAG: hypothetical protein CSB55_07855 [Candidatus Cloacimonadota bacterium]|nr:MAG: hypothetical protein CSB55_07855 [Candidatus Cloacimonadota bacterium]